jgi:hypothetical protein
MFLPDPFCSFVEQAGGEFPTHFPLTPPLLAIFGHNRASRPRRGPIPEQLPSGQFNAGVERQHILPPSACWVGPIYS